MTAKPKRTAKLLKKSSLKKSSPKNTRDVTSPRTPVVNKTIFPPRRDYASLSLKDLLDAREAYHVYLSQLDNVIATAVGRYCIHEDDWYASNPPDRPRPADTPRVTAPRTLANSVIRPWSWPAVLVFVRRWDDPKSLTRKGSIAFFRALRGDGSRA